MKKINILIILSTLIFIIACEDEYADKIASAQDCLNNVTLANYTTKAETCRDIIDGLNTAEANRIRCASYFLQEGLTATTMAEAVNSEDAEGTTGDPMLAMMGIIGFSDGTRANEAVEACELSGMASYKTFAALGKTAFSMGGGTIEAERTTVYGGQTLSSGVQCDDGEWITAMQYSKAPEACIASESRPEVQEEMEEAARVLQQTGDAEEKSDFADSVLLMEESKCDADNYADNKDLCDDISAQTAANTTGGVLDKEAFTDAMLAIFLND